MLDARGTDICMTAGDYGIVLPMRIKDCCDACGGEVEESDILHFAIFRVGTEIVSREWTLGDLALDEGTAEVSLTAEESAQMPVGRYAWSLSLIRDGDLRATLAGGILTVLSAPPQAGSCGGAPGGCCSPHVLPERRTLSAKGEYDPTVVYRRLEMVRYKGAVYVARRSGVQGESPTDGEDWMLLVRDGTPGLPATINGQSALTLAGGEGIKVTQDGGKVTLALDVPDGNEVGY